MPFYEYECQSCHRVTEVLQKMSDPPLKKCPSCGRDKLQKIVSAPVFRLKGGGWYETDFKSDGESKRNLAGGENEAKSETKTETKAEPKPVKSETAAKDSKPAAKAPAPRRKTTAPVRTAAKSAAAARKPAAKATRPKARAAAKKK